MSRQSSEESHTCEQNRDRGITKILSRISKVMGDMQKICKILENVLTYFALRKLSKKISKEVFGSYTVTN